MLKASLGASFFCEFTKLKAYLCRDLKAGYAKDSQHSNYCPR